MIAISKSLSRCKECHHGPSGHFLRLDAKGQLVIGPCKVVPSALVPDECPCDQYHRDSRRFKREVGSGA